MSLGMSGASHGKIIEITLALYRVTDLFPKEEVLRRHIREKANEILSYVVEYGVNSQHRGKDAATILAKIDSQKGFLQVAKILRFVDPINLSILEDEYTLLRDLFEKELMKSEGNKDKELKKYSNQENPDKPAAKVVERAGTKPPVVIKKSFGNTSERQRTIVEHLKQHQTARVSDFYPFFGTISGKTIQRDLQDLVQRNILKREGEKRWTQYALNVQ